MNNLSSIIDPTSPVLISLPLVFGVFKFLFLIAFAIYVIYALVIVRQLALMSRSVSTHLEGLLKILGLVHLIAALFIWAVAFVA